jgi:hypothetical protein
MGPLFSGYEAIYKQGSTAGAMRVQFESLVGGYFSSRRTNSDLNTVAVVPAVVTSVRCRHVSYQNAPANKYLGR